MLTVIRPTTVHNSRAAEERAWTGTDHGTSSLSLSLSIDTGTSTVEALGNELQRAYSVQCTVRSALGVVRSQDRTGRLQR